MKPKYRRFVRNVLPSLIVIPSMAQVALAGTIVPDTPGNILVPGNYNGGAPAADSILASGGTTSPFQAIIESGANITGDAVLLHGIIVSSPNYTVTNEGTINATAGRGISSAEIFTLENYGYIEGNNSFAGVHTVGGSVITNYGGATITGDNDGVRFTSDGGAVFNSGLLEGTNGSHGINGEDSLEVTNYQGGIIRGEDHGIDAGDSLDVSNTGLISSSTADGVHGDDFGYIVNESIFDLSGNVVGGGQISGTTDGVDLGNGGYVLNRAGATITGGEDGVEYSNDGVLDNYGTITGGTGDGVDAGDRLDLYNAGTIRTTGGSGASGGIGSTVENAGSSLITGDVGVTLTGGGGEIYNRGEIEGIGGTAISLGDTLGVGDNYILISNDGEVDGDIVATGTGNILEGSDGIVYGNISGIQTINVLTNDYFEVYGDITGPTTISVAQSGGLGGEGTWQADINLANGSIIYAGEETNWDYDSGVLDIDGNVVHAVGSGIWVGIDGDAQINNNGTTASLIGSVGGVYNATNAYIDLNNTSSSALRNGVYLIVEDAGGTVLGGGNTVWYEGYSDTVLGNYFTEAYLDGGDLVVSVDHNFSDLPGLTKNQRALGEAFDTFMDIESDLLANTSTNWELRKLIEELDYYGLGYTQDTLGAIVAPAEAALGLTHSVLNSNYRVHRQAQDHLAVARASGEIVTNFTPTSRDAKGGVVPSQVSTETVGGKGNVWGSFSYDWQDYEGVGSSADFDGEAGAFTAGFDYRVAPNLIVGLLLDGSKADLDNDLDGVDVESFRAAIYGTWGASTGLYTDFLVGYGVHDLDFADGDSLQALGTIGYALGDEKVKHGPFAGLEYQKVDVDSFDYNSVIPVDVDSYDVDSLRGLVGYRFNGNLGTFRPYASIAYAHEFKDDESHVTAEVADVRFRLDGAHKGSAVLLTAGTGIKINSALTFDVGYRGEITVDDEGTDSHGGSLGLNYKF